MKGTIAERSYGIFQRRVKLLKFIRVELQKSRVGNRIGLGYIFPHLHVNIISPIAMEK